MRIGVDLGGTKIAFVRLADAGHVDARFRVATPREDYAACIEAIADGVERLEAGTGGRCTVGVGTPGSVVQASGCMKNCNSTWLNDRPLPADLARRLDRPVAVANDADCFALSEASDGAGAGADCVFGVILGTGVGGGIVHGGRLLAGPNGLAGEWGHNPQPPIDAAPAPVRDDLARLLSRACYCGRRDCIETWLSGPGLARTRRALAGGEDAALPGGSGADVCADAEAGDEVAQRALALHEWQLAAALATVVNLLDPHVVVLGGGVSRRESLYHALPERLDRFVFSSRGAGAGPVTPVRRALHGDASGVRGAAWLGEG